MGKNGRNDMEILKAFYTYVTEHITYDDDNSIADYEKKRQNKQRERGVKC